MKKFNLLVTAVATMFATAVFAQNTSEKWYIGIGAHATDHTSVRGAFDGFFDTDDYSIVPPLSKLTVARSIGKNLAVDLQASIGEIDNKRLKVKDEFFLLAGLGVRYSPLSESKSLKWLDPYVRVGANYHRYDYDGIEIDGKNGKHYTAYDDDYKEDKNYELGGKFSGKNDMFVLNGGVGINFWITKNFGLNIESQYNWVTNQKTDYSDFFQHSASIIFKFGNNDRDKDGIPDKEDRCPDIPGLPEFQGCPDTDGDGIPDPDDACPNEPGPKENNGCPWPDTDGDGVLDKDDACPTVPGPKENNGCPWPDTDGDGVLDKDDACPTVPGPKENNGCPWTTKDVSYKIKNILFEFNSAKLTKESLPMIADAAHLLKDKGFDGKKFYVDGHTDRVGSVAVNNKISKERAQAVVNELVKEGISKDRLEARGFGKSELLCKEHDIKVAKDKNGNILYPTQEVCDKENRRVVILDQNEARVVKTVKVIDKTKKAPAPKSKAHTSKSKAPAHKK
ncbi:OmpA family protein [Apibacter adventoris]|uniref:OmpA family protein n=1 Tax=Apibacter adventoris TaxID=1679466 RepID=UPI000CF737E2|nr:OmpA family protein [Apibacter adventoris]PQL95898.1 flagellar motor protein MotB [Apibacter adventoris]